MAGLFLPEFFAGHPQWKATPLFGELDGNFPNHEADPLKAENLVDVQKLVASNTWTSAWLTMAMPTVVCSWTKTATRFRRI